MAGVEPAVSALGSFLRARRARLQPAQVGVPVHPRRRTQGLRREEVATLAGVSVDYYTRLEQGRDTSPSASVLRALADALRLDADERAHLFLLTGQAPPRVVTPATRAVREPVQAVLDRLSPAPAFALTPRLDVAAWNAVTGAVLLDFATVAPDERNLARLTLLDGRLRRVWGDYDVIARESVAQLRAATGRFPSDARLRALIGELLVASPDFATRWSQHDVAATCGAYKRVVHPQAGELRFWHETLDLPADGLQVVVYLPADAATALVCDALAADLVPDTAMAVPRRLRSVD